MSIQSTTKMTEENMLQQKNMIKKVKELLTQRYKDKIPMAHVHSYGCQQNVSDGEKLKGMLAQMGYGFCDHPHDADFVLYNTCAVRKNAENRVFGNVGALKQQKKQKQGMLIGLCGCMMQQSHMLDQIKRQFSYVDMVFGTHVLHQLPSILYKTLSTHQHVYNIEDHEAVIAEHLPILREGTIKARVPIMYGCNNFCTYCIVPYVRGRERSRETHIILKEIEGLIREGFREITLLGQNVNSYGEGLEPSINFSQLLKQINDLPGDFWVRFMTSHPKDATIELIDTIVACNKICKHFHLPVQSGSDRILQQMNRHYNKNDYLKLVYYAKQKCPAISFSSDIIVGFPGEEKQDFQQTLELIEEVRYDSLFTFIYSKREGTVAATIKDSISDEEKAKWFATLLEQQKLITIENARCYRGKQIRVLVEAKGKTAEGYLMGRNEQFMVVEFQGSLDLIGQFVEVKIIDTCGFTLLGEQV